MKISIIYNMQNYKSIMSISLLMLQTGIGYREGEPGFKYVGIIYYIEIKV